MKKHSVRFYVIRIFIAFILFIGLLFYFFVVLPFWGIPFNAQRHTNVPLTPAWALECWLWEDDHNTAEFVDELLQGYKDHDIPVRTILIDSPWSTRYNDFNVDVSRYPDPDKWFLKLQDDGYRVVLWMTCMVDSFSKDTQIRNSGTWFKEAKQKGYLAGNGYQMRWWKGRGGFIDYTNPDALNWWQNMQDNLLYYGIDGWKLDGTAIFFSSRLGKFPVPYQRTYAGWKTTRQYMDMYYRKEYEYGLTRNPEFITLSRSIDRLYAHPEGFAPLDAAPVTWVGDQKHTWKTGGEESEEITPGTDLVMEGIGGIEDALKYILTSAKLGYCVIGSDIAGFSGKTIPSRLYIRWTQFSTFCGLFMNGGHGERRLWKRSQQELDIIRKFSWLHTELVPYMYSHVVSCHNGGKPLQRLQKGKYHYLFGDDFLVAPIYQDSKKNQVTLPKGQWRYFFDDDIVIDGPRTIESKFPLDEYPVYIRQGAIVPMNIQRSYTGLGDEKSADFITWLIYPETTNFFTLYHPDGNGSTTVNVSSRENNINIHIRGVKKPHILRIKMPQRPAAVILDDVALRDGVEWNYVIHEKRLVITTEKYQSGQYNIRLR